MQEVLAQDRRLALLRSLDEAPGSQLNEGTAQHALEYLGHKVGHDIVRADFGWLTEHGLVRVEKLSVPIGELWVAHLTTAGSDVASGRSHHPGVARRGPD